jgi:hypothetical protein
MKAYTYTLIYSLTQAFFIHENMITPLVNSRIDKGLYKIKLKI